MSSRALTLKDSLVAVMVYRDRRMHMSITKGRVVYFVRDTGDGKAEIEWDGDRFIVSLEQLRTCCAPSKIPD